MFSNELTYGQRAEKCRNPVAKEIFSLMEQKQSNLALSADVVTGQELLKIAEELGPYICLLKTHIDILRDFHNELIEQLQQIAAKHRFFLFEDRKFADIGHTVKEQYASGMYHIADWAHVTNAHILPGPGIIKGLKEVGLEKNRGLLLLAQMSSEGNFLDRNYADQAIKLAEEHEDFVIGFIAQKRLIDKPHFLHMTPGVQLQTTGDEFGQKYHTPEEIIEKNLSDIIIVGRGIYRAQDPVKQAQIYQQQGWNSYLHRIAPL